MAENINLHANEGPPMTASQTQNAEQIDYKVVFGSALKTNPQLSAFSFFAF